MCGRARCSLRADEVPRACGFRDSTVTTLQTERYRPSYNVSPGTYLPVLRRDEGEAELCVHCMKWGLVPSFTKKTEKPDHFRMFNARSESISEKASFRRLIPNKRCLVAVEGFYEWKKEGSRKQPYYIHFKDQRPLVFAALYDSWTNSEGEILNTFTILTTRCSSALEWLHDRMPVILGSKSSSDSWLNKSSTTKVNNLLMPYEGSDLVWYPVTPDMGKTTFDGPECIKEVWTKDITATIFNLLVHQRASQGIAQWLPKSPLKLKAPPLAASLVGQIKLKTENATPISKFFFKNTRDTKHTSEPKPEKISDESTVSIEGFTSSGGCGVNDTEAGTIPSAESLPTDDIVGVKEENLEEETKNKDTNVDAAKTSTKGEESCGLKRDYALSAAGLKHITDYTIETKSNPKKGRTTKKDGGSGQPTLHSYFGTK